jgi:hypothetical protein
VFVWVAWLSSLLLYQFYPDFYQLITMQLSAFFFTATLRFLIIMENARGLPISKKKNDLAVFSSGLEQK